MDRARRNVVEFRHKSWWNEDVYAAFREAGIIFCSCSGPRLPNDLIKTADEIYVRFTALIGGIVTITAAWSWRNGRRKSAPAERSGSGRISTMTATAMRSATRECCGRCFRIEGGARNL
jgi:hypothetical protein